MKTFMYFLNGDLHYVRGNSRESVLPKVMYKHNQRRINLLLELEVDLWKVGKRESFDEPMVYETIAIGFYYPSDMKKKLKSHPVAKEYFHITNLQFSELYSVEYLHTYSLDKFSRVFKGSSNIISLYHELRTSNYISLEEV